MVRLRGRWVRADPRALARVLERRRVAAGEALAAALGGTLTVDGQTLEVELEGPLRDLADRLRGHGPASGSSGRPRRARRRAPPVPAAGPVVADRDGRPGPRRRPGRRHGAGQDRPGPRAAPGPPGPRPRPTLVVCPASVLANWERETARFAPGVPIRRFHGPGPDLDDLGADEIVVATYGVVRRDAEALAAVGWGLVVADEAQAVKNPIARTARALRASRRRPLRPHGHAGREPAHRAVGDPRLDHARAARPARARSGPTWRSPSSAYRDAEAADSLRRIVRPFLLRRRKTDPTIAPDLPPKTETDRIVPLTAEQATLYQAVTDEVLAQIESAEGIARRGLVLKLLTALKQICNHPAQYLGQVGAARRPLRQARRGHRAARDRDRARTTRCWSSPSTSPWAASWSEHLAATRPPHLLPARLA